jgi:hypothetical protein
MDRQSRTFLTTLRGRAKSIKKKQQDNGKNTKYVILEINNYWKISIEAILILQHRINTWLKITA